MFGHKSIPTRIYDYGAKPPSDPGQAKQVADQMFKAHRYRNALVELELKRREQVDKILPGLSPDLAEVESCIAESVARIKAIRTEIKAVRARTRKRTPATQDQRNAIEANKEALQFLQPLRKHLRGELFGSPEVQVAEAENGEALKKLRAECALYSGTYLFVEQSMSKVRKGAPPKFARWTGDGHLAIQLEHGLSVSDLFGCQGRLLRAEPVPPEAWLPGGRHLRKTKVWFRAGSTDNGSPIWAVIQCTLHRPLPTGPAIKWAHLLRVVTGSNTKWHVQFALARASGWKKPDCAKKGVVGIDVGWRLLPTGDMRVAFWNGSDGRQGEVQLPARWLAQMKQTREIRGHRDRSFNAMRDMLIAWTTPIMASTSEEFRKRIKDLVQWKSSARLANFVHWWKDHGRFEGDKQMFEVPAWLVKQRHIPADRRVNLTKTIFDIAWEWRGREMHLWRYEAMMRERLLGQRHDMYRVFAADMRRQYKTARIEELDLRDFHVLVEPERDETRVDAIQRHVNYACQSSLIQAITQSLAITERRDAAKTTMLCSGCGSIEVWDHNILVHTCSKCGLRMDQDDTASRNLKNGVTPIVSVLASGSVTSGKKP